MLPPTTITLVMSASCLPMIGNGNTQVLRRQERVASCGGPTAGRICLRGWCRRGGVFGAACANTHISQQSFMGRAVSITKTAIIEACNAGNSVAVPGRLERGHARDTDPPPPHRASPWRQGTLPLASPGLPPGPGPFFGTALFFCWEIRSEGDPDAVRRFAVERQSWQHSLFLGLHG